MPVSIPLQVGDFFGRSVASTGNISSNPPDFVAEIAVGAPGRRSVNPPMAPGAVFVLFPTSAGTISGFREIGNAALQGLLQIGDLPDGAAFGESVAWVGNLSGSGNLGLAVGAPNWPGGGAVVTLELASPEVNGAEVPRRLQNSDCPDHPDENLVRFDNAPAAVLGTNWRPTVQKIMARDTQATVTVKTDLLCPPVNTSFGQLWITGTTFSSKRCPSWGARHASTSPFRPISP